MGIWFPGRIIRIGSRSLSKVHVRWARPVLEFIPGNTLFFFDELQACPNCATSLKFFKLDGRFDVICSGSLMGINYHEIESNSVGYKDDYEMHSMDFEEFLWAKGYSDGFVDELYGHMLGIEPLSALQMEVMLSLFRDYVITGGMPEVVATYVKNKNFSGTLGIQKQLLKDYEEDISKYAEGLDKAKVKAVYNHISTFLAKENKRFQITKIAKNARNRDYIGCVEWLADAGVVNICYCLNQPELPLKGNYDSKLYKIYFKDTGLLIASLDEEAQEQDRPRPYARPFVPDDPHRIRCVIHQIRRHPRGADRLSRTLNSRHEHHRTGPSSSMRNPRPSGM